MDLQTILLSEAAFSSVHAFKPAAGEKPTALPPAISPSLEALIPQGKEVKHSSRPRYLSQALNVRAAFQCTTEMQYSYCNLANKYFTSAKVIHIARITAVAHTHILI